MTLAVKLERCDYSLICLCLVFICAHLYHSTQLKLICLVTQVFYSQLSQSTFLGWVLLSLSPPLKNIIEGNWDQFSFYQMISSKLQILKISSVMCVHSNFSLIDFCCGAGRVTNNLPPSSSVYSDRRASGRQSLWPNARLHNWSASTQKIFAAIQGLLGMCGYQHNVWTAWILVNHVFYWTIRN